MKKKKEKPSEVKWVEVLEAAEKALVPAKEKAREAKAQVKLLEKKVKAVKLELRKGKEAARAAKRELASLKKVRQKAKAKLKKNKGKAPAPEKTARKPTRRKPAS